MESDLPPHVATIGTDGHPRHIRHLWGVGESRRYGPPQGLYAADQMRDYAAAKVTAERERIIAALPGGSSVDPQWVADMIRGLK